MKRHQGHLGYGLRPGLPLRSPAFTLIEMLVAVALLLVIMGLASQVFKIALDGTSRLTAISGLDRSARMLREQLSRDLASIDPTKSILVIQPHPSPAYWTARDKQMDDDNDPTNGIGQQRFSRDALRENPTVGYDVLDTRNTSGAGAPDGSFDWTENDNFYPLLPRADILMFVGNLPDERSKIYDDVSSDGPVMLVYGHAELGEVNSGNINVRVTALAGQGLGASYSEGGVRYNNDSTDDWLELRPIPVLQNGGGPDLTPGAQTVAESWHLTRRAILIKGSPDPLEAPPSLGGEGVDGFAHVLSPTNPVGNQVVGFITDAPMPGAPGAVGVHAQWERHYLNWILGGEIDVVSPKGGPISDAIPQTIQDFVFEYEVSNRYFGGTGSLDVNAVVNLDGNDMPDEPGAVYVPPNVTIPAFAGGSGFYRGGVPAWWLARSHLDPEPPAALRHRLAHYFLPNCASFKVEWTPNDIRLEQAGLPEVVWIDPFKEPADNWPATVVGPRNSITLASVNKPRHLDEFEILAQKITRGITTDPAGTPLSLSTELGQNSFGGTGSSLYQVHQELGLGPNGNGGRFGLSVPNAVSPLQANVFDADPTNIGVQPSHNTHSWYAKDLETFDTTGDGLIDQTRTSSGSDPLWPKALRITVDLFDDDSALGVPRRHVFILPVGSR